MKTVTDADGFPMTRVSNICDVLSHRDLKFSSANMSAHSGSQEPTSSSVQMGANIRSMGRWGASTGSTGRWGLAHGPQAGGG